MLKNPTSLVSLITVPIEHASFKLPVLPNFPKAIVLTNENMINKITDITTIKANDPAKQEQYYLEY